MKEPILKKEDLVYEHINGWGRICEQVDPEDDCVAVNFDKLHSVAIVNKRKVSFTEYDLKDGGFSQERPKPEFEIGQRIWVWDEYSQDRNLHRYLRTDSNDWLIAASPEGCEHAWDHYSVLNPYADSIERRAIVLLRAVIYAGVKLPFVSEKVKSFIEEIDSYEK